MKKKICGFFNDRDKRNEKRVTWKKNVGGGRNYLFGHFYSSFFSVNSRTVVAHYPFSL